MIQYKYRQQQNELAVTWSKVPGRADANQRFLLLGRSLVVQPAGVVEPAIGCVCESFNNGHECAGAFSEGLEHYLSRVLG